MSDTNEELKNLTPEQKEDILKQVNTEVTSLKDIENKTGKQIALPDAEKMVSMASMSLLRCRKRAKELMLGMKKRELVRAVTAFLDLPQDGLPVYLKSDAEKLLFATGQRAISDRYIIVYHHTMKLVAEERLKKLQEEQAKKEENNGETAVQETK